MEELPVQVARLVARLDSELGTPMSRGNIHRTLDDVKSEMRALRTVIVGNGVPGMMTRLDRLEQAEKRRATWLSAIGITSIGLAFKAVYEYFTTRV